MSEENFKKNESLATIIASLLGCAFSIIINQWDGLLYCIDFSQFKVLLIGSVPPLTLAINKFFKFIYYKYSLGATKRSLDKKTNERIKRLKKALEDPHLTENDKDNFKKQYAEAHQASINIPNANIKQTS